MDVTYKLLTLQWEIGFDLDYLTSIFMEKTLVLDESGWAYGCRFCDGELAFGLY